MTHLVCGGSGFIGRHLMAHLRATRPADTVHTLDRRPSGVEGVTHTPCDLTDREEVLRALTRLAPDRVYHVAGSARVNDRAGIDDYFRSNFLTTAAIGEACERLNRPVALFLASSVHVYGNRSTPVDETTEPSPASLYAFSKYLAEEALRQIAARTPSVRVVVGRLYTCIGPGQGPGFVAADFCRRLAALPQGDGAELKTGPLNPYRRFLDVRDAVRVFVSLLESTPAESFSIFNIASPHEVTVRNLLDALIAISGKRPRVVEEKAADNAFLGLRLTMAKLESVFPAKEFRPLQSTLSDMYAEAVSQVGRVAAP